MTTGDIKSAVGHVLGASAGAGFALLFGSAVKRGFETARDIDIAASFARPVGLIELGGLAGEIERRIGRTVDLVDLKDATTLLRWQVAREGQPVFVADQRALLAFLARAPIEYFDLKPYLDREAEGLRRVLRRSTWSTSTL